MRRWCCGRAGPLMRCAALIVAVSAVVGAHSFQQQAGRSADSLIQFAREAMVEARYCFLITLDDLGQPHARLMDAFEPEADMTIWMATGASTRKVRQLRHDPRATLAYETGGGGGYVTLIGRVRLVDDMEERRKRWKVGWESFYREGPSDSGYLLLRFTPTRIELMSPADGIGAGPFTPVILVRQEAGWVVHERIETR